MERRGRRTRNVQGHRKLQDSRREISALVPAEATFWELIYKWEMRKEGLKHIGRHCKTLG